MIIESKDVKATSINFSNVNVTFDTKGLAEVDDELGAKIIGNFPNKYWEKGKKPKQDVVKKTSEEIEYDIAPYKAEIERLKDVIKQKDIKIAEALEGQRVWKEKVEELMSPSETIKEDKEEFSDEEIAAIVEEMKSKNKNQLVKWVSTQKEFENVISKEDIEDLSRDEIIDFVKEKL